MTDALLALCLTIVVECACASVLLRGRPWLDRGLIMVFVVGINLVTHPVAWAVHPALPLPALAAFGAVESVVIVVEAAALRCLPGVTTARAVTVALAMNAASAALGLLVF